MSKEKLFSFNTPEFSDYNLEVVSFKGSEEVGELYRYEIDLISKNGDIDFDKMLETEVSLQLHNKDSDDIYIHGVLEYFEAQKKIDEYISYKAYLVPKLWWLTLAHHQQIFLDKKITDILESILKDATLTSDEYEFRLQGDYDAREYVCQYKESRYDFLKRWMQRDGIYFYFEQDEDGCKVIITDTKDKHQKLPNMGKLLYRPVTGLQEYENQAVSSVVYRSNRTIKSVHMKNYDYEKPSLDIDSVTESSGDKYTQAYLFGHNLKSKEEAAKLAKIDDEKFKSLAKEMSGESNILSLKPGYIYSLNDYFKDDLNDDYLMLRVESEGSQRGFLTAGFTNDSVEASYYNNTFMMIPSQTQFRSQTLLPWPHIGGMISAIIDASGSGETAELDKQGRYKVIMPFDISGKKDAKASAYITMAQPSAGKTQGMHFPLHKGTEVLIAFKGGDPDQPIITGAVPNIDTPSPVNENNVTQNIVKTDSGNYIVMEDKKEDQYIKIGVDDKNFFDIKGDSKAPFTTNWEVEGGSNTFVRGNTLETRLGLKEEFILAEQFALVTGAKEEIKLGEFLDFTFGLKQDITIAAVLDVMVAGGWEIATRGVKVLTPEYKEFKAFKQKVTENITDISDSFEAVIEDKMLMVSQALEAIDDRTRVNQNCISIAEDKIRVVENKVKTEEEIVALIDNKIEAVENRIVANETKIEENTTSISDTESVIECAGVVLQDYMTKLSDAELEVIAADIMLIE